MHTFLLNEIRVFDEYIVLLLSQNQKIMNENLHIVVENRLKAILADRHKTCKWLAQEIDMSENTVSRWCSNRVQPSLPQLGKIAYLLDVDVRELLKPTKEL